MAAGDIIVWQLVMSSGNSRCHRLAIDDVIVWQLVMSSGGRGCRRLAIDTRNSENATHFSVWYIFCLSLLLNLVADGSISESLKTLFSFHFHTGIHSCGEWRRQKSDIQPGRRQRQLHHHEAIYRSEERSDISLQRASQNSERSVNISCYEDNA